jgi:hypothetical protein
MGMLRRPDRDGVTAGPPSRASPLPQWDWCIQWEIGWLSGRLRWQASSDSGLGVFSGRLVGSQAAIAGKPAPTVDWVYSVGDWSAVGRHRWQASSHSWIECRQLEVGRLSGRLREQARSHSGLGVFSERLVGCQAAIAGRPAPTVDWVWAVRDWSARRPPSLASQLPQWD